ncbi:putative multidrug resistance protein fnx1 [Xylaria curta]|nr:putative multidrug resistance protein fnx1 [Xylaria curta]
MFKQKYTEVVMSQSSSDEFSFQQDNSSDEKQDDVFNYLSGRRLHTITAGLMLAFFLVNLEITIVGTALVSITNDLKDFARASWVVTAYLITYTAGLVIWAKLSDILGRKPICITALLIFTVFSGGCGAAQTMIQLIVLRAFQGVGASGIYALTVVFIYELVPVNKYPQYTAMTVVLLGVAFALGPIFGGLISEFTTWRWVFLLNVPAGVLSAIVLYLTVPGDFPHQGLNKAKKRPNLSEIDFLGVFLMTAALALTITGLEQAASTLTWTSAVTLGPLVASGPVWVAFLFSQWYSSRGRPGSSIQPVFPWRFTKNRVLMALFLNSLATGAVSITCNIELPIRYQTTLGVSPLQAGLRLLPLSVVGPLGAIITAIVCKNRRVPPVYAGLVGTFLQIIGLVFFTRSPPTNPGWSALYGFEVLVALGFGTEICLVSLLTPFIAEKRDLAVATAVGIQCRIFGSAIVISITTAVGNGWVKNIIRDVVTTPQLRDIFRSTAYISTLPESAQYVVRSAFVEGFNLQMRIVLGFAVASVFSIFLMWQKSQIRVE